MRRPVVLYNPRAVFHTMPLALLALGSALDPARYEVRIVDGRLEADPAAAVLAACEGALALGVTVLTGAPIRDALAVTRVVRARVPSLPVVWGGWHPSLFPDQTLEQAGVTAVVGGQGEETFAEIVERLNGDGRDLSGIAGCHAAGHAPGTRRPLADVNGLRPHDYGLIDVERYFAAKGARQLDYTSSAGCRFRCSFCADPQVYRRGWTGLEPERVVGELARLASTHGLEDVAFQDETFFTSTKRVGAIAEGLLARGTTFTWTATMRADQGARLPLDVLGAAARSGLRRVMVGVEAGTQAALDAIRKDITLEQVDATAEACRAAGVGVLFNFIVGFPGDDDAAVDATLALAKRLSAASPSFEIAVFYYKPYPGNALAERLAASGHRFPETLAQWAEFDYVGSSGPWVTAAQRRRVERFKFYQHHAYGRPTRLRAPLRALARLRCRLDAYGLPFEKALVELVRPPARLS